MLPFFETFEKAVGEMGRNASGNIGLLLSAGHDSPCIAIALHNNNIPFIAYTHSLTTVNEDVDTLEGITKYVQSHKFVHFDTPGDLFTKVAKRDKLGAVFAGLGGDEMCSGDWQGIDEYIYLFQRACKWNALEALLPYCNTTINQSYDDNGYAGRKPLQNYLQRHGVPLPRKKVAFSNYLDERGKQYVNKTEKVAAVAGTT